MPNSDYLFQRKNSKNWYIRLQNVTINGIYYKSFERSLQTSDRDEAKIIASDIIRGHRECLLENKRERQRNAEATNHNPLIGLIRNENGSLTLKVNTQTVGNTVTVMSTTSPIEKYPKHISRIGASNRTAYPSKDDPSGIDQIIRTWTYHKARSSRVIADINRMSAEFQTVVGRKKTYTREDGRQYAFYLLEKGNKSSSVERNLALLRAAFNIAYKDGLIARNPFSGVAPKRNDSLKRLPIKGNDMVWINDSFGAHDNENDHTLWMLLACTGMRLGEAFQIEWEDTEFGVRYFTVGTKTESSLRRVPIPEQLLKEIPPQVYRKLFPGKPSTASNRLMRFLKKIGVSYDSSTGEGNRGFVVHSLRHRAKDRLRAVGCPLEIQLELLGHEKKTVASKYGAGHPMPVLKNWIDQIGYLL